MVKPHKKTRAGVRHQKPRITIQLPESMLNVIASESGKRAMSISTWIRSALIDHLGQVSDTKNK